MDKIKSKFNTLLIDDYYRKSSRAEDKQALSLDGQEEEAKKAREMYGIPKALNTYKESRSAKYAGKRVLYSEMKMRIVKGEINCIFAWHLNRIARNMTEAGELIDWVSDGKLIVITFYDNQIEVYDEDSDTSVMAQKFGANKQYSHTLSKDVKRGQRTKAKLKGLPQGLATIGYKNSKQGEKGERWWYVDEERLWKIKKLFELFLTGRYSIGKLHKYATEELKLTTPSHKTLGGKLVTREYLGKILHNPIFAGFFFVQGERYTLDKNLPRIITVSEHNKIKLILTSRCNPKVQKHEAVFSGFIKSDTGDFIGQDIKRQLWCDCRHKFAYRDKKNCPKCNRKIDELDNPEYFIQNYYYNNRKKKAGLEYKSITEERITNEIIEYVEENLKLPFSLLEWTKKHIYELKDQEVSDSLNIEKDKGLRKTDYENKKKNATKLFIEGKINEEERKQFLLDVENEYTDLNENNTPKINWVEKLEEIIDVTVSIKNVLTNGDFEAKRVLLTRLGSHWTWDDKNLLIYNAKSVNTFSDGIKTVKPILSKFGNRKALVEQELSDENSELCITLRAM